MTEQPSLTACDFSPRLLPLRDVSPPPQGVVDLWFLDLQALGSPLQPDQAMRRADLTPRLQRTLRRFYLRLLLGAYLGVPGKDVAILRVIKGKPVLDPGVHTESLQFSTAGADGCCLIGVSGGGPVGVDLEPAGRKAHRPLALARRYFSPAEAGELGALSGAELDAAFLHTWACKEAVVKAAGHGIANQLCRFSVCVDPRQPPAVAAMEDDDPAAWRLAVCRPAENFCGAVALRHSHLEIRGFNLAPAP